MAYDAIVNDLGSDGEGVRQFSQRVEARSRIGYGSIEPPQEYGGGICRGLVTEWLKCKKEGRAFAPDNSEALLEKHKTIATGFMEQTRYKDVGDSMTSQSLKKAGLDKNTADSLENTVLGFAENSYGIADKVLNSDSRYFILSLLGHSLGVHREWVLFGRSSTVYIYDPNIGELKVTGSAGIKKALEAIRKHTYPGKYLKGFKLRAYKG